MVEVPGYDGDSGALPSSCPSLLRTMTTLVDVGYATLQWPFVVARAADSQ